MKSYHVVVYELQYFNWFICITTNYNVTCIDVWFQMEMNQKFHFDRVNTTEKCSAKRACISLLRILGWAALKQQTATTHTTHWSLIEFIKFYKSSWWNTKRWDDSFNHKYGRKRERNGVSISEQDIFCLLHYLVYFEWSAFSSVLFFLNSKMNIWTCCRSSADCCCCCWCFGFVFFFHFVYLFVDLINQKETGTSQVCVFWNWFDRWRRLYLYNLLME